MKIFTDEKWISSADFDRMTRGECPHCNQKVDFVPGPRGGFARNILCPNCRMEFNAGPAGAQVIAIVCPPDRQKEIYGL